MIYFYTIAYNAAKTLNKTIESVLNQTKHSEKICYYLVENGSTDNGETRKIIDGYAKRDSRVHPVYNKQNHVWGENEKYLDLLFNLPNDDFFCFLDADDEYAFDFLENAIDFMNEYELNIVAVGSDFIHSQTGETMSSRTVKQNSIIGSKEDFSYFFPLYHQFMRTAWGKLFRTPLHSSYVERHSKNISYGADTVMTTSAFLLSSRIGIMEKSLHRYYVSPKSVSYQWNEQRINSDRILHQIAQDFLIEKCGFVSQRNTDFLRAVHLNAIRDTMEVLLNSPLSEGEKIDRVIDICLHEHTQLIVMQDALPHFFENSLFYQQNRIDFFSSIADWLLQREEVSLHHFEQFCEVGELACAAIENADGWMAFKKMRAQFLIQDSRTDDANTLLCELEDLIPDDEDVLALRRMLLETPSGN